MIYRLPEWLRLSTFRRKAVALIFAVAVLVAVVAVAGPRLSKDDQDREERPKVSSVENPPAPPAPDETPRPLIELRDVLGNEQVQLGPGPGPAIYVPDELQSATVARSMIEKRCARCGEDKPLSDYRRHSGYADGRRTIYKDCEREERRGLKKSNP